MTNALRCLPLIALALLTVAAEPSQAAVFRVGTGLGCTHGHLADAIAAAENNGPGSDEIRLAQNHADDSNPGTFFIIDQSLRIVGGYQFCTSTAPSGLTKLRGGLGGTFSIASQPARRSTIELRDLDLYQSSTDTAGGVLAVFGRADVSVRHSMLHNNRGGQGGAIYVDGLDFADPARLTLMDTEISSNSASEGGGIYCRGDAHLAMQGASSVVSNKSRSDGGGVALHHCSWSQEGGRVGDNTAAFDGGGFYAIDNSYVGLGWGPANGVVGAPVVVGNYAFRGAGIAIFGAGSYLDARGLQLIGNGASFVDPTLYTEEGAALLVGNDAAAWMRRDQRCPKLFGTCSSIMANYAKALQVNASVVQTFNNASVVIAQTDIAFNTTRFGISLAGALLDSGRFWLGWPESRIVLRNSTIYGNSVGMLLGAAEADGYGRSGSIQGALLTMRNNEVNTIVGNGPLGMIPISLAATVIDETEPFLRYPLTADSRLDCILSRSALGVAASRSVVADPLLSGYGQPQSGSPAIDYCSADSLPLLEADVVGQTRPLNHPDVFDFYGPVDVGAYEVVPPVVSIGPGR